MFGIRTHSQILALLLTLGVLFATGCGNSDDSSSGSVDDGAAVDLNALLLEAAPEGATPITELKESAEEGDEVIVHVVVGGNETPIAEGLAVATVVDISLDNHCLAEDDHCPMPWDYCCTARDLITANSATIQLVDEQGAVVSADFSELFEPQATLTVIGTVGPRPNDQVLVIYATGIHVGPIAQ